MSSKDDRKRKYKWPLWTVERKYRYSGVRSGEIDISNPRDGFHYFMMMSIPPILIGTLALVFRLAPVAAVIFLIAGGILLLISAYAFMAYREEEKIQEEIAKEKAEKQKVWREKRRLERRKRR